MLKPFAETASDTFISQTVFTGEDNIERTLRYYVRRLHQGRPAYGIKITRLSAHESPLTESTCALTHSYDEAEQWTLWLASGNVTPYTLHDMADELVGGSDTHPARTYAARQHQPPLAG